MENLVLSMPSSDKDNPLKIGRFANSVDANETTRESPHQHLYFL